MKDPFQTLGIPSTSSEDEIKSAYRRLAKQYHPDLHPGDKNAEEKMKEVNEAYAEAIRVKKNGGYRPEAYGDHAGSGYGNSGYGSYGSGGYGSYSGYGNYGGGSNRQTEWNPFEDFFNTTHGYSYQQNRSYHQQTNARSGNYDDPELQTANDWIVAGRYQEALNLLNRMTTHGASWHYLNALANMGLGNRIAAQNHARQAVQLDPGNSEYRDLLNQLQGRSNTYRSTGGFGDVGGLICSNPCASLCVANMLLNCLCGRSFICC